MPLMIYVILFSSLWILQFFSGLNLNWQVKCTFFSSSWARRASEAVDLGAKDGRKLDSFTCGSK